MLALVRDCMPALAAGYSDDPGRGQPVSDSRTEEICGVWASRNHRGSAGGGRRRARVGGSAVESAGGAKRLIIISEAIT